MAGVSEQVRARLVVMKTALEEKEGATRLAVDKAETQAMLHLFQLMIPEAKALSKTNRQELGADLLKSVTEMRDVQTTENNMELVNELCKCFVAGTKTWRMQDYTAAFQYFSDRDWREWFGATSMDFCSLKISTIVRALGCANPSEKTVKLWLSAAVQQCVGATSCVAWPQSRWRQEFKQLKQCWKAFVGRDMIPLAEEDKLTVLPSDPNTCRELYPLLFARAFPDGAAQPVACQLDLVMLNKINMMFGCRLMCMVSDAPPQGTLAMAAQPAPTGATHDLVVVMRTMQQDNMKFLEAMVARSALAICDGTRASQAQPKWESQWEQPEESQCEQPEESVEDDAESEAYSAARRLSARNVARAIEKGCTMKRPASAMKRPASATPAGGPCAMKRPARCESDDDKIWVATPGLPKGWRAFKRRAAPGCVQRADRYFLDPSGMVFRSMVEVHARLGR